MQYDGLPFCRGTSLKEPKVESYNQLCFALIFSYQLQPSHCPSYPTQTSQLSLSLLLSCSFPVPSLSLLLLQAAVALKQSKYIWTDQCVSGVVSPCRQSPFFFPWAHLNYSHHGLEGTDVQKSRLNEAVEERICLLLPWMVLVKHLPKGLLKILSDQLRQSSLVHWD